MKKFVYDMYDQITPPTLILSTKYHKHLGTINNVGENIANDFNMASHQEISFDVYKTLDGELCELWDDIVDFKYVYVPEHEEYYELQVTIDDADNTIKHCVGISAGECELSQRYVRDFHCNDETDILYSPKYQVVDGVVSKVDEKNGVVDFEYDDSDSDLVSGQTEQYKATVLYRPIYTTDNKWLKMKKQRSSLLYRILKDKCPDWSISHVDDTLKNIQRTFNIDGATVYDALTNTIATELGCLFKFNSVNRTIAVYDLKNTCNDCGFRGEFIDKCPRCGSTSFIRGYGAWKKVYISPENTALQISVDGDADSVKNCFKIIGGDDLITATVININPNQSSYIYRFSDDTKADMPQELVTKLNSYQSLYQSKLTSYTNLTDQWYNKLNEVMYYQTKMMPETPMPEDTTAEAQLTLLMSKTITVSVENINTVTKPTADLSVEGWAKVLIDPRYTVEVFDSTLSAVSSGKRTWTGKFKVKSLGGVNEDGDPDEATSTTTKTVTVNGNYEQFLQQKIKKTLDRSDAALMSLFDIENDNEFKAALELYSLDRLTSFSNTYQSVLEVLINMKVGEKGRTVYGVDVYNTVYKPYYYRKSWIDAEAKRRETTVKTKQKEADNLDNQRKKIQTLLDLPTYLGDELYKTFVLYLREDTYSNSNYISDGLDDSEVVEMARELFNTAESELIKASELQFTLTGQLGNFLNTEEFKDFKDEFEIGDYIICKADEKLYRLRITNVNYSYDSPEDIQITFSNIVRGGNFMSDVSSVLSKASSMATSYNYVAHQANQGNSANSVVKDFQTNGFNSSVYNIIAGKNQDVVIDDHGITAREFDDTEGTYTKEQLKITSHSLAFTDDNWESASLSLGKQDFTYWDNTLHRFVDDTKYGLSANFIHSGYIWGTQIVSGEIISQNYVEGGNVGAYIDLDNGYFTFAGGKLKYDANGFTISGDIEDGSVINNAIINNSAINNANNFIVTDGGNVVLNGTVSGTAWATKQDKLTAGTNITIDANNVISATGGADYREITQAQYDALSYAEKHNGKIYFITDGESGGSTVIVNPTGTPTAVMTKISVDGVIYSLPTGVTDVRVNNTSVVTSGIANIDLSTYATTTALTTGLATKQNTLTAGTNITITNGVISATGGSEVEANPSGTATGSLTSIGIDGDIYSITGGGGGNVDDVYVNGTSVLDSNHIAQVQSYKKVTQAEYDALPASKFTDGILYCISDSGVVEGQQFTPMIYSLAEREVGTWIDAKPLYQRTFDLSSTTLSDNNWNNSILGTAGSGITIKNYEGYFSLGNYYSMEFKYEYHRSNGEYFTAIITSDGDDISVRPNMNAGMSVTAGIVTIWYTKDADTPGSAQYNSLGVPMVHYSTDEQIVGTWIDGATIYQRTYSLQSPLTVSGGGTWINTNIDISFANYLVDAQFGQVMAKWNIINGVNDNGTLKAVLIPNGSLTVSTITIQYTKSTS